MTPRDSHTAVGQCRRCGHTWPRDPALEVPCPTCLARVGVKCRRPSGHGCDAHASRDREAMRQGVYGRCPGEAGAVGDSWPFREVSRRKVSGGSKTLPADEITWTGVFRGTLTTFTTRPRLLTASASFLVPSNARLRTSILKRDEGHCIDLCVRGRVLSDAERENLAALAQAQDPERRVRVRLAGEPVRGNAPTRPAPPPRSEAYPPDPGAQLRLL